MENPLTKLRSIADYQFGAGTGKTLFPDDIDVEYSKATGKIRYINHQGTRIATLRPTDGMLSLSIQAAKTLTQNKTPPPCLITVQQDVAPFIAKGGDTFAAHVTQADPDIHAKDEVIVQDEQGQVLAVGRAMLSSSEMKAFKTGVAVKVRHGTQ
ncbi:MAG: pseudouridine synthase [Candidatus Bathyarchaeota archaeon]|nr:pseudouridine synthase [Candidatus Bathyarchaeota archaeon]